MTTTNPSPKTPNRKATEVQAREMLAFLLFAASKDAFKQPVAVDEDESMIPSLGGNYDHQWRESPEARTEFRGVADCMITAMENAGIRVAISSSPALLQSLEALLTVPARRAYTLEEASETKGA